MTFRYIATAALLGCGSPAAPAPTAPTPTTIERPPTNALPPAVVQALQGIPLYVTDLKGLVLFADEERAAQDVIAAWAHGEGLTVVPPQQTSAIFERATRGQHATTGAACGAPLSSYQAVKRWATELGARGKIEAGVYCDPTCSLQLSLSIGTDGEGGTEFFAAPFDPKKPWKAELAERLGTVADNGGHNQHGHLNNPVAITGIARSGPDLVAGDDVAVEDAAALRCVAIERAASVQLEIGPRGTVARCEPRPDRAAAAAACVCAAIAKRTGTPNTRGIVTAAMPDRAPVVAKNGKRVHAYASTAMIPDGTTGLYKPLTTDPAIEMWQTPDRDELIPCFRDATESAPIDVRATLDFDATGTAAQVIVVATKGTLAPTAQACIRDVFQRVRAPCPSQPRASATAEVHVTFEAP